MQVIEDHFKNDEGVIEELKAMETEDEKAAHVWKLVDVYLNQKEGIEGQQCTRLASIAKLLGYSVSATGKPDYNFMALKHLVQDKR